MHDHELHSFGALLRQHRLTRSWTQEELAERASVSVQAVSTLERGARRSPRLTTVRELASALGLLDAERAAFFSAVQEDRVRAAGASSSTTNGAYGGAGPVAQIDPSLPPTNLPDDKNRFIGREREIGDVSGLLRDPSVHMVTLTGPGGIGKTRLAVQVGRLLRQKYRDGVFLVSLASLSDPTLVPSTIAAALSVTAEAGEDMLEVLIKHLHAKQLLLVIDNYEHILSAASMVSELLEACRELQVLITSRIPLHLSREHQYAVVGLTLPNSTQRPDLTALSHYEAVALFIDRSRAVKADFQVTSENASAVGQICFQLDGLPLAIELAAAWTKLFPPDALLNLLSSRLTLLTGGARDLPVRHQTLRAAIDWSYSLLTQLEQTLFAQLSTFVGGCTYDAARTVCDPDGDLDLLEGIASLVDKSLLQQEGEREPRFTMLETIREYAEEKLEASREAEVVRRRHIEYFHLLACQANEEWFGPQQPAWAAFFEAEQDNFRAALTWCLAREEVDLGLELLKPLGSFWFTNSRYVREGQCWFDRMLNHSERMDRRRRADALHNASWLAVRAGDWERGETLASESLTVSRKLGDTAGIGVALTTLAVHAWNQRRTARAWMLQEESLVLGRQLNRKVMMAIALQNLGYWALCEGHRSRAIPLLKESADLWRGLGAKRCLAHPLRILAAAACDQGDLERAKALLCESLGLLADTADQTEIASCLDEFGVVAAEENDPDRAARLWGAAAALREANSPLLDWAERERHDRYSSRTRAAMRETRWTERVQEGRTLTLEQAIACALSDA